MMPLAPDELKICQLQAKIFELSVSYTHCSSPVFIRRFMFSRIAKSFDDKSYLTQSNNPEDVFIALDEEFGKTNYGKKKYSADQMFWIGYIYRMIAIKTNLSTKQVFKIIPSDRILNYYPIYHTYDIVDAAERMTEENGISNTARLDDAKKVLRDLLNTDKLRKMLFSDLNITIDDIPDDAAFASSSPTSMVKVIKLPNGAKQNAVLIGIKEIKKDRIGSVVAIAENKSTHNQFLIVCPKGEKCSNQTIKTELASLMTGSKFKLYY